MTPSRLFEFLEFQIDSAPLTKTLSTKYSGKWNSISSDFFYKQVQKACSSLIEMGIKKGDKIALISTNNRTEWCIMDLAILQIGAITVPIYPTITAKDYEYILNHSESIICFISDKIIYDKISTIKSKTKKLKEIYSFDKIGGCKSWELLLNKDSISNQQ